MMTMPYARCAGDCRRICTGQRCANKYPTLGRAEIPSTSSAFSMGATQDLDNPHESTARIIDPGSAGGPRRANNLLQRREWFCVLRARARGHRDVVTVVGHVATISAGEWITASGEWVNDRTHGQQFKARFLRTSPPTSADGIEKYLSSGMR
jgi:hypothetical protein